MGRPGSEWRSGLPQQGQVGSSWTHGPYLPPLLSYSPVLSEFSRHENRQNSVSLLNLQLTASLHDDQLLEQYKFPAPAQVYTTHHLDA